MTFTEKLFYALPFVTLFLPLLVAIVIMTFCLHDKKRAGRISVLGSVVGFVTLLVFSIGSKFHPEVGEISFAWLDVEPLFAEFGLKLDFLSLMMALVVTGVGMLIQIFSKGYMADDKGYSRYFALLSLFKFSMLGIVFATNFLQMFIFWELVGVSSYLLIGFWFGKNSAADASKKAFLTNRIGDFGFLLGILICWAALGSLNFSALEAGMMTNPWALGGFATAAGLLIFCGAMGKSAQFPLHVWLPDAMEGPTPVSALIHAATMVAAGVYMLCRCFFLFNDAALMAIGYIGAITALLAALMAIQQDDIKRILAYSTLSQLGYMVMGVGLGEPGVAMFHLTTHAFFKALLFLGAASVIMGMHHEQNIWKMGGLKAKMPKTTKAFFWGGLLPLVGMPFFSGWFSKDAILGAALENEQYFLYVIGAVVAAMTAFYMFRLYYVVFEGPAKTEAAEKAHESSSVMTIPLGVLMIFGIFGAYLHIDIGFENFFHPGAHSHASLNPLQKPFDVIGHNMLAVGLGGLALLFGWMFAKTIYSGATEDVLPSRLGPLARVMKNRFYFDELYTWLIAHTQDGAAKVMDFLDRWILAGFIVRGTHGSIEILGRALRLFQSGNLQTYALLLVIGLAATLFFVVGI
ncbi:NADH-quinone oxidoreductase subunit L [Verrucomicrobia bacterium]|nr:NADH-quinone oxidoreductase subunit L [Verrucomicrobiota bacterium]